MKLKKIKKTKYHITRDITKIYECGLIYLKCVAVDDDVGGGVVNVVFVVGSDCIHQCLSVDLSNSTMN